MYLCNVNKKQIIIRTPAATGNSGNKIMTTTQFFNEIQKVNESAVMTTLFDYAINKDKSFKYIYLQSEPTEEVKAMCEANGFEIIKNKMWKSMGSAMASSIIWQILPINRNEVELVEA